MKFLLPAIIAIALFTLAGCGGSKSEPPAGLPATQKAPTFSTAAANEHVKNLSQAANDYVAAIKARDVAKITTLTPKFNETMNKGKAAAKGLKSDEAKKLWDWSNSLMQQVKEAATEAAGTPAAL